jgi:hypothetical protein
MSCAPCLAIEDHHCTGRFNVQRPCTPGPGVGFPRATLRLRRTKIARERKRAVILGGQIPITAASFRAMPEGARSCPCTVFPARGSKAQLQDGGDAFTVYAVIVSKKLAL